MEDSDTNHHCALEHDVHEYYVNKLKEPTMLCLQS